MAVEAPPELTSLLGLPKEQPRTVQLPARVPAGLPSCGRYGKTRQRSPRSCSPFGDDRIYHTAPLFTDPSAPSMPRCFDKASVGWTMLAKGLAHDPTPESLVHRSIFTRGLPPRELSPRAAGFSEQTEISCSPQELSPRGSDYDGGGWAFLANGLSSDSTRASPRHILQGGDPPHRTEESSDTSPRDMAPKDVDVDNLGWAKLARGFFQQAPLEKLQSRRRSPPRVSHADAPWERLPEARRGRRHREHSPERSCSPMAPYATEEEAKLESISPSPRVSDVLPVRISRKERSLSPPYGTDFDAPLGKPRLGQWEPQMSSEMRVKFSSDYVLGVPPTSLARQEASSLQLEEACAAAGAAARRAVERAREDARTAIAASQRRLTPERDEGALAAGIAAADALKAVLNGALPTSKGEEAAGPQPSSVLSQIAARHVSPVVHRAARRSQSPKDLSGRKGSAGRSSGGSLQWRAMHSRRGKDQ